MVEYVYLPIEDKDEKERIAKIVETAQQKHIIWGFFVE